MQNYNKVNIGRPVEWQGFNNMNELLGLEHMGLTLMTLQKGKAYSFAHSHSRQEELYILLAGQAQMRIDDELLDIFPGDLIRVAPKCKRALRSVESAASTWVMVGASPGDFESKDGIKYEDEDPFPDTLRYNKSR